MATWYVDSAAVGTGAGTSWVNACNTLSAAIAASSAGDDFNVANTSAETTASAITWAFKGTSAAPNRVFSCDKTNSPAQASDLLAGAAATSTALAISVSGFVYIYGMTLTVGTQLISGAAGANSCIKFDTCKIINTSAAAKSLQCNPGGINAGTTILQATTLKFSAVTQWIEVLSGRFYWRNTPTAIDATGSIPTNLFDQTGNDRYCMFVLDSVDLSATTATLFRAATIGFDAQLINCKLGAAVTIAGTPTILRGGRIQSIISDSAATGYRQEIYDFSGTLTTSTASYNNATDGVTPISWHVVSTGDAKQAWPFECPQIVQWVAAGTFAASVVQITSATAALTNADVWVEAEYLGNGSFPIASLASSGPATQLTAGSALAAGTWATGGLGNNYQLAVPSFTTALAGYVRFTVKVAKASLTLNIDPAVTVA